MMNSPEQMHSGFLVGGMQPFTTIDFPGRLAAVLFAQGCNLRCRFCYNRTLLPAVTHEAISWDSVIDFLKDRQGFIEGVVFSGGEPCRQSSLLDAMHDVHELGYEIALHTNGFYPEVVKQALDNRYLQFIAVDFKAPFDKYQSVTGQNVDPDSYSKLVDMIVGSGIKHEFRTTLHPALLTGEDILKMGQWLADKGVSTYAVQKFRHGEAFDAALPPVYSECLAKPAVTRLKELFKRFIVRSDGAEYIDSVKAA